MNRKIGMYGSLINLIAVIAFALTMVIGTNYGGYLSSVFISIGFLLMICAYAGFSDEKSKVAAYTAMGFAISYITFIILVYFTQMTTVRFDPLTEQAAKILDYSKFGLMFTLDLLGYMMMAFATFFISFTFESMTKADRWLKWLLRIHGIFAVSCFVVPLLNVFDASAKAQGLGIALLEFWCLYFIPIGVLSLMHFRKMKTER